jgi:hypothetical protein
MVSVIEKIAPLMKLNTPVVIEMLTKGFYTIKLKKQVSDEIEEDKNIINREVHGKIMRLDINGDIKMISSTEYEYRGDMTWHQLVDKMIRMGFDQNPDFDKECGSNSYESKEEVEKNDTEI